MVIERGRRQAETTRIATGMDGQWRKRHLVRSGLPWLTGDSGPVKLIDELERHFPTLVTAGCRVGIGVATGADKIFIDDFAITSPPASGIYAHSRHYFAAVSPTCLLPHIR